MNLFWFYFVCYIIYCPLYVVWILLSEFYPFFRVCVTILRVTYGRHSLEMEMSIGLPSLISKVGQAQDFDNVSLVYECFWLFDKKKSFFDRMDLYFPKERDLNVPLIRKNKFETCHSFASFLLLPTSCVLRYQHYCSWWYVE